MNTIKEEVIDSDTIASAIRVARTKPIVVPDMCKCSTRIYLGYYGKNIKQRNQFKKAMIDCGYRYIGHNIKAFYIGYDNASGKTYIVGENIRQALKDIGLQEVFTTDIED